MDSTQVTPIEIARAGGSALEDDLKQLIVDALMLEDVDPNRIDSEAPLFGEGLGLDSIDALELAMALHKRYGIRTRADDVRAREIFQSVRSLASFVSAQVQQSVH